MNTLKQIIQSNNFETNVVLKALNNAYRHLGELKGKCRTVPNQSILIKTLTLQEAQDSSTIENIITTQDEIFKYRLQDNYKNLAAKEVSQYGDALYSLFQRYQAKEMITMNMVIETQKIIKGNDAGIRKQKGTALLDETTGQIVYRPPTPPELPNLLKELEIFINEENALDPIIKMALIHHQFASIHPFYDGNGRIGRMINIIYLVKENLLEIPVLYLSRYINHNKSDYYRLLQEVRDKDSWQEWLLFMINGVAITAKSTIEKIDQIKQLQQYYKNDIRTKHPKIYSQDLINNIFKYPYTKIQFLQNDLKVSRLTASRYLEQLTEGGLLIKLKLGRENYYINQPLVEILKTTTHLTNTK